MVEEETTLRLKCDGCNTLLAIELDNLHIYSAIAHNQQTQRDWGIEDPKQVLCTTCIKEKLT